jgi:hypothetical protein
MGRNKLLCISLLMGLAGFFGGRALASETFTLYPLAQLNEYYSDNILLSSETRQSDWVTAGLLGFYLGMDGPTRSGGFAYETTFQEYINHPTNDSFGGGQYFQLWEEEHLSRFTTIRTIDSFLYANGLQGGLLNGGPPVFNTQLVRSLLSFNNRTLSNYFTTEIEHEFNAYWSGTAGLHQHFFVVNKSLEGDGNSYGFSQSFSSELSYRLRDDLKVGPGFDLIDFRTSGGTLAGSGSTVPVEAYYPFGHLMWTPVERFFLSLASGPIILHEFGGSDSTQVKPGGLGIANYSKFPWDVTLDGGQQPSLIAGFGLVRSARGRVRYNLTQNLSSFAGISYIELIGTDINGTITTYTGGLQYKAFTWLNLYVQYLRVEKELTAAPSQTAFTLAAFGLPPGRNATANIYIVGASVGFPAFKWSMF